MAARAVTVRPDRQTSALPYATLHHDLPHRGGCAHGLTYAQYSTVQYSTVQYALCDKSVGKARQGLLKGVTCTVEPPLLAHITSLHSPEDTAHDPRGGSPSAPVCHITWPHSDDTGTMAHVGTVSQGSVRAGARHYETDRAV